MGGSNELMHGKPLAQGLVYYVGAAPLHWDGGTRFVPSGQCNAEMGKRKDKGGAHDMTHEETFRGDRLEGPRHSPEESISSN